MAIAVYNSPPGGTNSLPAKTDEKIVGIQLNTSNNVSSFWTVFGKVVVNNTTASPATVRAQLVVAGPPATVLDTSKATIPANGFVSISLEGVPPESDAAMCVEIHCQASSSASAELARLIAISVNPASVVTC
jgi:hypothetical protein